MAARLQPSYVCLCPGAIRLSKSNKGYWCWKISPRRSRGDQFKWDPDVLLHSGGRREEDPTKPALSNCPHRPATTCTLNRGDRWTCQFILAEYHMYNTFLELRMLKGNPLGPESTLAPEFLISSTVQIPDEDTRIPLRQRGRTPSIFYRGNHFHHDRCSPVTNVSRKILIEIVPLEVLGIAKHVFSGNAA